MRTVPALELSLALAKGQPSTLRRRAFWGPRLFQHWPLQTGSRWGPAGGGVRGEGARPAALTNSEALGGFARRAVLTSDLLLPLTSGETPGNTFQSCLLTRS